MALLDLALGKPALYHVFQSLSCVLQMRLQAFVDKNSYPRFPRAFILEQRSTEALCSGTVRLLEENTEVKEFTLRLALS
jgi:hypothetical protein